MKKIIYILSAALILFMMQACPPPPEPEPDPLIGTWHIINLTLDNSTVDVSSQDQLTLSENGTYNATIPELSFFPTSGTWKEDKDKKQLILGSGDFILNFDLKDNNRLELASSYENFKANTINYELTLEKQ